MKFISGYQFIYYLLKNNIVFSFDSDSFDHPQLSSINLNIDNDITVDDSKLISDIEYEIYETMNSYMENIKPFWIHGFKIYPKLLKSGELDKPIGSVNFNNLR